MRVVLIHVQDPIVAQTAPRELMQTRLAQASVSHVPMERTVVLRHQGAFPVLRATLVLMVTRLYAPQERTAVRGRRAAAAVRQGPTPMQRAPRRRRHAQTVRQERTAAQGRRAAAAVRQGHTYLAKSASSVMPAPTAKVKTRLAALTVRQERTAAQGRRAAVNVLVIPTATLQERRSALLVQMASGGQVQERRSVIRIVRLTTGKLTER